jgi:Gpi18-like mannosyltransferase
MTGIDKTSYALGVLCGLSLLALLAAALAVAIRPMLRERDRRFRLVLAILVAVAIVKLALLRFLPGEKVDLMQFKSWGAAIALFGPAHVYDPQYECIYTPAYLYALWPAAALASDYGGSLREFIEIPLIIADLLLAISVYAAVRRIAEVRFALPATLLAAFNPALTYASTVWGQNDSALAFPVLLSIVMAVDSQFALAWALAIVAALIKSQGLILLPILAWWTLVTGKVSDWFKAAGAALVTAIVVLAPFQLARPWHFLPDLYRMSIGWFPWASLNAFNLMSALGGLLVPDSDRVFGPVSFFMLGNFLFLIVYVIAGYIVWRRRTGWSLMFSVFLVYLGMFVFAPRMHERYLYYAVALLSPLVFSSWAAIALYATLSATLLLDMACAFFELVFVNGVVEGHLIIGPSGRFEIALINVAAFVLAAVYGLVITSRTAEGGTSVKKPNRPDGAR